jgi:hypothetical protein
LFHHISPEGGSPSPVRGEPLPQVLEREPPPTPPAENGFGAAAPKPFSGGSSGERRFSACFREVI